MSDEAARLPEKKTSAAAHLNGREKPLSNYSRKSKIKMALSCEEYNQYAAWCCRNYHNLKKFLVSYCNLPVTYDKFGN